MKNDLEIHTLENMLLYLKYKNSKKSTLWMYQKTVEPKRADVE